MPKHLASRSLSLRLDPAGRPASLDLETRSIEVVAATEGRVTVWDWDSWEPIDEVLLMSGLRLPANGQVPLLDSHSRYSTASVIGSARGLRVVGDELHCRAYFAETPDVETTWIKARDGHLTDVSVGYLINESIKLKSGERTVIGSKEFEGPIRVVTAWTVKELSVCPIGADEAAKARADIGPQPQQAKVTPEPQRKEDVMDKKLVAFLVTRGLSETATDEEAYAFLERIQAEPAAQPVDLDQAVRTALEADRQRVAEITAMGRQFDCGDLAQEMIVAGATLDDARAKVLEHVAASRAAAPAPGFRVSVTADERDKFRAAAVDAISLRGGMRVEQPAPGADELRGYTLRELARRSLQVGGLVAPHNPMEMIGRALTTDDFQYILADVANKSLFEGYESANETWQTWCATGSVSDFKTNNLVSLSEGDDLDQVNEAQPYKYGDRTDAREQYAIATYGKLFAITRETIINDDLGALTDQLAVMGEAAARKVGDIADAVLTANRAMRDGVALFAAGHNNLGTTSTIKETSIAEAIKLMKLQEGLLGKQKLNIRGEFIIAPVTIEGAAEIFFGSPTYSGANLGSTRVNPYAGNRFTRVYDARLDDSSTTIWYMAGPKGKTVKVFFLNGVQTPYLETRKGWSVDGVEYKVRIDAGAKAVDWKAMVRNAGVDS